MNAVDVDLQVFRAVEQRNPQLAQAEAGRQLNPRVVAASQDAVVVLWRQRLLAQC